jgi:hypothetical protein
LSDRGRHLAKTKKRNAKPAPRVPLVSNLQSEIRNPQSAMDYGSSSTFQYASLMNFDQLATGA